MIEEEEDSSNYHVDYDYSSSFFPPAGDHCDRLQCLLLLFLRCCEWRKIQHQYRKADSPYSPQPIGTDNDICGTKEKRREENPLPIRNRITSVSLACSADTQVRISHTQLRLSVTT
jgi:hypothetical protein